MKRLYSAMILSMLTLLASCSFAPIRVGVADITLPGNSSMGRVCYVEVTEGSRVGFNDATYRADATYVSNALLGPNDLTIRVYGRTSEPANPCVSLSETDDIALSDPVELSSSETKRLEVGGGGYSGDLADLIREDTYWLGAALTGGTFLSLEERIELVDGTISVSF